MEAWWGGWGGWGVVVVEAWSCWAEEGAGVNYSITGWLSQELFKQAPASRGLGLITPAKVTLTTPSPLAFYCHYYRNIHMERGGRKWRLRPG